MVLMTPVCHWQVVLALFLAIQWSVTRLKDQQHFQLTSVPVNWAVPSWQLLAVEVLIRALAWLWCKPTSPCTGWSLVAQPRGWQSLVPGYVLLWREWSSTRSVGELCWVSSGSKSGLRPVLSASRGVAIVFRECLSCRSGLKIPHVLETSCRS